jgi:hypothetical protein
MKHIEKSNMLVETLEFYARKSSWTREHQRGYHQSSLLCFAEKDGGEKARSALSLLQAAETWYASLVGGKVMAIFREEEDAREDAAGWRINGKDDVTVRAVLVI